MKKFGLLLNIAALLFGAHVFASSMLLSGAGVNSVGAYSIECFLVAGGGATVNNTSGFGSGSGAGAGGVVDCPGGQTVNPGGTYPAVIGNGGNASNGQDTTFLGLTAVGGGVGVASGNSSTGGAAGGSGSGAGASSASGTAFSGGTATAGQGNAGGNKPASVAGRASSGGGCAAAGTNGDATVGAGLSGGAGCAKFDGNTYARGGNGGDYLSPTNACTNATANTGDGAKGAASSANTNGCLGGSGRMVLRYPGAQRGTGGVVTSAGGYTIHTFNSSGNYNG